jgi:DNA-binding transcriptional ArsR family regulator/cell division protein FtsB
MSTDNEEPYSTIFTALKHPIRRRILRMLSKQPMTFSEMIEVLGVSNSFLTYHLENLGELVGKTEDGKYRLSSFGEAANATMTKVEDIPASAAHQSSEPKRVVRRSVAMALAMMCIVLVAGIGGAIIYYTSVANDKDKTISTQNSQISRLQNETTSLNGQITSLQEQVADNQNTIQNLKALLANQTVVTVQGLVYSLSPGGYITLNVTISQISNLYAWQAKLLFDPTILNCGAVAIGGSYPNPIYDNVSHIWSDVDVSQNGSAIVNATLLSSETGFTGSGVLCRLEFIAIASGVSSITLSEPDTWVLNTDLVTIPANITILAQYGSLPHPPIWPRS